MGAFIVPRAQRKLYLPIITIEEIVNVLVVYLSRCAEYVHSTAEIEREGDANATTFVLHGHLDPKLGREIIVRATIQGRRATTLGTKLWADPLAVHLESEDLQLGLDLVVEPQTDRTITISKIRGFGDRRGVNPGAENSPAISEVEQGEPQVETAARPETPVGEGGEFVTALPAAVSSEDLAAPAREATITEVVQTESAMVATSEAPAGEGEVVGELPADASGDPSIATASDADEPEALVMQSEPLVEREVSSAEGDAAAPVLLEVSIEHSATTAGDEIEIETTDAPIEALTVSEVPQSEVGAETPIEGSDENSAAIIQGENEPEAAISVRAALSSGAEIFVESPAEISIDLPEDLNGANGPLVQREAEIEDLHGETEHVAGADGSNGISEVLYSEEELIIALRGEPSITISRSEGTEAESRDAHDADQHHDAMSGGPGLSYSEDGQAAFDQAERSASAAASPDGPINGVEVSQRHESENNNSNAARSDGGLIYSEDGQAVFDQAVADEGSPTHLQVEKQEMEKMVSESMEQAEETAARHDEMVHIESEQAVFGPGQRERCAIMKGDGKFEFTIVGESHYQGELAQIAGARTGGRAHRFVAALLVPEPNNFFDKYAVAVQIDKRTVGYLSFQTGPVLLRALTGGGFDYAACAAAISSDPDPDRAGELSVKLDASVPFVLVDRPQQYRREAKMRDASAAA